MNADSIVLNLSLERYGKARKLDSVILRTAKAISEHHERRASMAPAETLTMGIDPTRKLSSIVVACDRDANIKADVTVNDPTNGVSTEEVRINGMWVATDPRITNIVFTNTHVSETFEVNVVLTQERP